MIVPMQKVSIIVQSKDAASTVEALRVLGVLHLEHSQTPKGADISALGEDITLINTAIGVLSEKQFIKPLESQEGLKLADWKFTARHIIDSRKRLEQLEEYSRNLTNRIVQWENWGDFDPEEIEGLAGKNIYLRLYQIPAKEIKNLPPAVIVKELSRAAGVVNCALIWQGKVEIPFKELALPKMGLEKMKARLSADMKVIESVKDDIRKCLGYRASFLRIKNSLESDLEFHQAVKGMGQSGGLVYLAGYAPYDMARTLQEAAKKEQWALALRDPSAEDKVPTLIRNPRWLSIISPIFKFLEIFPEYREWDISPVFIVFFSLFFGMLIGDAGYGIVYMLLTFWAHKKIGNKLKDKSVFYLFYLLSFCAIIWGLLTGTFFGQEWFLRIGYKPLAPALNNPKGIRVFCFFIGALHLSIAHIWRAIIKLPAVAALAEAGWVCVVWSVFLLAKMLILGEAFPSFGAWLIISGVSLVIMFNNPQRNILKILNVDLITLALSLISSFGEVVSYIRLFAVGMAGVAIADAFNAMAADIGAGSIAALLGSVFVVMLGHILCLVLGPLSVLVHGIRLNLLEFSGHANISWSGIAYKPFKE